MKYIVQNPIDKNGSALVPSGMGFYCSEGNIVYGEGERVVREMEGNTQYKCPECKGNLYVDTLQNWQSEMALQQVSKEGGPV